MAKKQQPIDRLTAKLSALRKTLRGEERQLLDRMVLGSNSEVAIHAASATKPNAGKASATKPVSEIAVHSASATKPNAGKASATRPVSEVAMHASATKPVATGANATGANAFGAATRIVLDQKAGVYTVVSD